MQNEPVEVTLKVTDVFEKLGISYLIGGSLARAQKQTFTFESEVSAKFASRRYYPFQT
ncbi:MAG: hypothetical protein WBW94_17370 [Anaerolineales bacterium]